MEPNLYIVATPIGNLDDITIRAKEVLRSVGIIAAEDTRHTRRLLSHFDIDTPLRSFHDFSSDSVASKLLDQIESGVPVALVSDAGTPLVSDPGYVLVAQAHKRNIKVVPIPGASAAVALISAAGIPSDRFSFEGFLPAKSQQRLNALEKLRFEERTMIFYEAPHRISASLEAMVQVFGEDRMATVGRELTKTFETISRAALRELVEFTNSDPNQQRGELVIAVTGYRATSEGVGAEAKSLFALLEKELPPKKAARIVAEYTGEATKQIYQWSLTRD